MLIEEEVTLRKLEVFLCFMKHGHMVRVAEALGQSTVSVHRALHSLEEGLRCPLFRREGRRLVPLAAAHALAEHAERAVEECMAGIRKAREVTGFGSSRLRVGSLYSLTVRTLPQLLIGLKTRRPDLDVELTLSSNKELLHQLNEGGLDAIVIATDDSAINTDLLVVPMFTDEIFFAAPKDSRYAGCRSIDLKRVSQESFVCLNDDFATHRDFRHACELAGFQPRIIMKVGDIFSLINLISGGMGCALLPGRVADFSPKVQLIPLASRYRINQRISLILPRSRERDPNLLALSAECRLFGSTQSR
ncbi:MAG: LysR family transcriptional regulator [Lautropia sp.]|nr:LysR family transcriptional regulator [Lautropia sp.]